MKLSEVFSQLAYGELSQLSIGGGGAGVIDATNYDNLIAHVNLGLLALYKRFPLKEGTVSFTLDAAKTIYSLDTNGDVVFLEGEEGEFGDDIIKIEGVQTLAGVVLGLNQAADPYSCSTPNMTTLRVPASIAAQDASLPSELKTPSLTVVYRAKHPIIVKSSASFNPARVDIELPWTHLEPLLLFVASRIHNPVGMTNEFHAGNSYYAKYEKACAELELKNIMIDQGNQNTHLERGGWV